MCAHFFILRFWSQSISLHIDIKITRMRAAQHLHFVEVEPLCVLGKNPPPEHDCPTPGDVELTTVSGRDEGSISFASPTFLLVVDSVDIFRRDTQNV